jgi:hypothetical protein
MGSKYFRIHIVKLLKIQFHKIFFYRFNMKWHLESILGDHVDCLCTKPLLK